MANHILFVDDDKSICRVSAPYLKRYGYEVTLSHDGEDAVNKFAVGRYDLIILDLMLPKLNGWHVFQVIRERGDDIPVIMLTARGEVSDRVEGLNKGADDYIVKPFDPAELVARVNTVLRRINRGTENTGDGHILQTEGLILDLNAFEIYLNDVEVSMPRKEFDVLSYLMKHPNRVFTRDEIVTAVWGFDFTGDDRVVDVCVNRIREKLSGSRTENWGIETVWGVGYKFKVKSNV